MAMAEPRSNPAGLRERVEAERIDVIPSDRPFVWRYKVRFNDAVDDPVFAMLVKTREGVTVYGVDSKQLEAQPRRYPARRTDRWSASSCPTGSAWESTT